MLNNVQTEKLSHLLISSFDGFVAKRIDFLACYQFLLGLLLISLNLRVDQM